jgi:Tfp pilus assembly protein PilF
MESGARQARHIASGERYMAKQDYARAVPEFRNAIKIAPNSADAHYRLGMALLSVGRILSVPDPSATRTTSHV